MVYKYLKAFKICPGSEFAHGLTDPLQPQESAPTQVHCRTKNLGEGEGGKGGGGEGGREDGRVSPSPWEFSTAFQLPYVR